VTLFDMGVDSGGVGAGHLRGANPRPPFYFIGGANGLFQTNTYKPCYSQRYFIEHRQFLFRRCVELANANLYKPALIFFIFGLSFGITALIAFITYRLFDSKED